MTPQTFRQENTLFSNYKCINQESESKIIVTVDQPYVVAKKGHQLDCEVSKKFLTNFVNP